MTEQEDTGLSAIQDSREEEEEEEGKIIGE